MYIWLYPLRSKDEAKNVFLIFQVHVERFFISKLKCLQTDWGGEFWSLQQILSQQGALLRYPWLHTHQVCVFPTMYRSLVGGLQYLTLVRANLSFAVHKLISTRSNHSSLEIVQAGSSICQRHSSTWSHFKPAMCLSIEAFSDADWASYSDDRRSTTCYVVFFGGNPIVWSTRKQKVVSHSSIESEYWPLLKPLLKSYGFARFLMI